MPNLIVSAVSEWNGKALKRGQNDISSFEKGVNKLGKALIGVFAAQKLAAFGKASVQAFLADEAAATKLSTAVNNLGLSMSNPGITDFIATLEHQSGVLDEQLRPAFQGLLTTTGDVVKSQELLKNAIDISRGSTVDLATVSQDLDNAYVGITKGLKKYNLGLTATQLKSASFTEIMTLLNKQFSGASADYLATYSGKLDILKTAADNAKETIGKGLVDALVLASGQDSSVQGVADAMQGISDNAANAARGVGVLVNKLTTLGGIIPQDMKFSDTLFAQLWKKTSLPGILISLGKKTLPKTSPTGAGSLDTWNSNAQQRQADAAKALADKKALKIQQELNKVAAAKALKDRIAAQNAKVALLFNQTAISATAALQGKLTDEERNKVLLMLALEMDNTTEAEKLAQKVALASDQTGLLAQFLRTLPDAKNPFEAWDVYLSTLKANSLADAQAVAKAWADAQAAQSAAAITKLPGVTWENFATLPQVQQQALADTAVNDAMAAADAADAAAKAAQDAIDSFNASQLGSALNSIQTNNGYSGGNGGFTPAAPVINLTVNNPMGNDGVTMVQNAVLDAIRLGNNLTPAGSLVYA